MTEQEDRQPEATDDDSLREKLLSIRLGNPAHRNQNYQRRKSRNWMLRRRLLYPLLFVLSILATISILWWFSPVENLATGEREFRGTRLRRVVGNLLTPEQSLDVSFGGRRQLTLLLVGLDHVPPTPKDPGIIRRSDSVLLSTTDFDTKQVRVVSIPRDGWVEHWQDGKNYGYEKLGHTYAYGQETDLKDPTAGISRTQATVEHLLGQDIDYYVVIEFEGLVRLIDSLGGLTVDVEKNMKYRDRAGGLNIDLEKGEQHLSGEQVVQYARFRKDALGDIGRMGRQQKVLRLIYEKLRMIRDPRKLAELASILNDAVRTNLSFDQLLALAQHADEFPADGFRSQTLPSYWNREPDHEIELPGVPDGQFVDAQAIFSRDTRAAREFLNDLAPPPEPEPESEADQAGGPTAP